jgi:hypothetical protein
MFGSRMAFCVMGTLAIPWTVLPLAQSPLGGGQLHISPRNCWVQLGCIFRIPTCLAFCKICAIPTPSVLSPSCRHIMYSEGEVVWCNSWSPGHRVWPLLLAPHPLGAKMCTSDMHGIWNQCAQCAVHTRCVCWGYSTRLHTQFTGQCMCFRAPNGMTVACTALCPLQHQSCFFHHFVRASLSPT